MRTVIRAAIILVFVSGSAFAKGKKAAPEAKSGAGLMDANDPAEKETSDVGPFAPKGATGKVGEEKAVKADGEEVVKARERDSFVVFGNVLVGFGKTPLPGPGAELQTDRATSVTLMAGGRYDVTREFSVGLRLPWTTASVRENGLYHSSQALGTPELMGEYRVALSRFSHLPILFGVGIPVAQGNYDINDQGTYRQGIVNQIADAASAFRDGELFLPKRLPLVLGVGIEYERQALSLHAATKFVLGFSVGGKAEGPPQLSAVQAGTYELKKVSFRNVTSGGIAYQFLNKPILYGAFDSWIATSAVNPVEFNSTAGATAPARIQVAFEPRLGARFGKVSPSLGYIFPIGGRLADSGISGLELHCDVAF